jgi:hypothetical protein
LGGAGFGPVDFVPTPPYEVTFAQITQAYRLVDPGPWLESSPVQPAAPFVGAVSATYPPLVLLTPPPRAFLPLGQLTVALSVLSGATDRLDMESPRTPSR